MRGRREALWSTCVGDVWTIESEPDDERAGASATGSSRDARARVDELVSFEDGEHRWRAQMVNGVADLGVARSGVRLAVPLGASATLVRRDREGGGPGPSAAAADRPERVARFDVRACPGAVRVDSDGRVLVLEAGDDAMRLDCEVLALGRRRIRESFERAADLLVVVARGALVLRVSDEDEPYELDPACALWIESPAAHLELDLVGREADTCAVLVEVRAARQD